MGTREDCHSCWLSLPVIGSTWYQVLVILKRSSGTNTSVITKSTTFDHSVGIPNERKHEQSGRPMSRESQARAIGILGIYLKIWKDGDDDDLDDVPSEYDNHQQATKQVPVSLWHQGCLMRIWFRVSHFSSWIHSQLWSARWRRFHTVLHCIDQCSHPALPNKRAPAGNTTAIDCSNFEQVSQFYYLHSNVLRCTGRVTIFSYRYFARWAFWILLDNIFTCTLSTCIWSLDFHFAWKNWSRCRQSHSLRKRSRSAAGIWWGDVVVEISNIMGKVTHCR